jgi:3-oxoacyl-[acyl-carrier protein] reductase
LSISNPTAPSAFFSQRRRVFLTGGSRGIGLAIREEFEKHGQTVICPSRTELDLSSTESVQSYLKNYAPKNIDILINNAGINFPTPIPAIELDRWETTLKVNLTAPFLLSRHFSEGMRKQGWGRILNVSSIFSLLSRDGRAAYSAAKAGLNGFTRTCAVEWGAQGVTVNAICPGYIDTALTRQNNSEADIAKICQNIPLKRLADSSEISRMAVFLCSDHASYLTGQCLVVDGGFSIQ